MSSKKVESVAATTPVAKSFTINTIARLCGFSNGAVRNWAIKPIVGQVYDANFVNVENVKANLIKATSREDVEAKLGVKLDDLVIVKGVRTSKAYLEVNDIELGQDVILRNYHYEKQLRYCGVFEDENTKVYIFKNVNGKYEAYSAEDLEGENTHLEEVED